MSLSLSWQGNEKVLVNVEPPGPRLWFTYDAGPWPSKPFEELWSSLHAASPEFEVGRGVRLDQLAPEKQGQVVSALYEACDSFLEINAQEGDQ